MTTRTRNRAKPRIVLCHEDHDRLVGLADTLLKGAPQIADVLFEETQRARVVKRSALPKGVIRMGSQVSFRTEENKEHLVTLVFPGDADIALGKLSVLTPVGAALIGLREGQAMRWNGRNGAGHELTVLAVSQEATPLVRAAVQ